MTENWLEKFQSNTELYQTAAVIWPKKKKCDVAATEEDKRPGRWILASYDGDSIIVYQAYNPIIAEYACKHGKFSGCPEYNERRMTWIKTNFLWMMYRSNWARSPGQQRILAIWLHQSAFDNYLRQSLSSVKEEAEQQRQNESIGTDGLIRLQWDPDHTPSGASVEGRRAVQLGLKQVSTFLNGQDILRIIDITQFVHEQQNAKLEDLKVPIERIYEPDDLETREHVKLDLRV
ncbi:unnamed protein product [Didymodactylos carnosus]|uniref:DUF4291 domain-containing protein n=2 Tax=Didymodactylos carnosus TaxID=1234261 RepID=A0A8S2E7T1_9BILA|nr:unnamed protein product [Didymodactylos carnosus]CAF3965949.1 unnamed protein product [Didymodactylos carnosus]